MVTLKNRLSTIKVKVPEELLNDLDLLIKAGVYGNRNEAIREAIRQNLGESHEAG